MVTVGYIGLPMNMAELDNSAVIGVIEAVAGIRLSEKPKHL
jgi:hypothetical protein